MAAPLIEFRDLTKRFPGIVALDRVSLSLHAGSCHGLVGENGAGKSTLGKILAGIYPADEGQMSVAGTPRHFSSPLDALQAGIGMVHQELALCENLSVAENLCLEDMPRRAGFVSRRKLIARAHALLEPVGMPLDVTQPLGNLSISQQQVVQIASAVGRGARVIVFDEPTSSLSEIEAQRLHELIRRLQSQGVTCLYVSHRMSEVFSLCDTITVLRDGRVVGTKPTSELDEATVVSLMIGRRLEEYFPQHTAQPPGEPLLQVRGLNSPGKFRNMSFEVRAGEVVGMAGLVGAGRTEVAEALFGLDPQVSGEVLLAGKPLPLRSPLVALERGVGLVPEDRKHHGLVLAMTSQANLTLPILHRLAAWGWIKRTQERRVAEEYFERLNVRAGAMQLPVEALSGGNQQKIVLARWLAAHCRLLILDEPTRGVDVGSKAEIHALIDALTAQGAGVLLISSELPEVLNLSTRILVLREGRQVADLPRRSATQEQVLRLMAGLVDDKEKMTP